MGHALRRLVLSLFAACALLAALLLPATTASAAETCIQPNQACTSWDPTSGPPGTKVTITGRDWPSSYAGRSSEISWGFAPSNTEATITVSGSGTFTANITVPGNAPVGKTSIDVNGDFTLGRNLNFEVTTASGASPSKTAVTVGRALTLDGNSGSPREKTSFAPGDPIWYAVIVTVPGSSPATITFTWEGNGPRRIFSDKNTVAIKPGTSSVYSPGRIPKDAPSGEYTNKDTVTIDGQTYTRKSQFIVRASVSPTSPAISLNYFAMGDSYSSGEGAGSYDAKTNTKDNKCHRSQNAWPRLLAEDGQQPGIELQEFVACSGATTVQVNVSESYPGEGVQVDALRAQWPRPKLITITIGGNDARFERVLTGCYLGDCTRRGGDVETARAYIKNTLPGQLRGTVKTIVSTAKDARVIVVGYPNIFPATDPNAGRTGRKHRGWLTSTERGELVALATLLDTTQRSAAAASGVEYASTLGVLRGHEMFTADPWVNPIRAGLAVKAGQLLRGVDPEQAHPSQRGQHAIAEEVRLYLKRNPRPKR